MRFISDWWANLGLIADDGIPSCAFDEEASCEEWWLKFDTFRCSVILIVPP